jgi:recombination DNA repair RAD52 pathway protein
MPLSQAQVAQLLRPIHPSRVLIANRQSHVSQHDIRAHLSRIFGFANWSTEITELRCVRDSDKTVPPKDGKPERIVPDVTYLCRMRLTIFDPQGKPVAAYEEVGTGTSPNLPDHGDAHDFAAKNAVSYALKRCATNLGDQFGLSLYGKGATEALVKGTLVMPGGQPEQHEDVQDGVPQQTDLGDDYTEEPPDDWTAAS